MSRRKLPKKIFVRFRDYEGNGTIGLEADTDISQMIDQDEICEFGIYDLRKMVKAKNSTYLILKSK